MAGDRRGTAAFGTTVFLVADGLFFLAAFFIYARTRSRLPEWPDVALSMRVSPTLAVCAFLALALGALLLKLRRHVLFPLTACALALGLIAFLWHRAEAQGLSPSAGRYGFVVYTFTALWAFHVAAALAALTVVFFRDRSPGHSAFLAAFLGFLAVVGGAIAFGVVA